MYIEIKFYAYVIQWRLTNEQIDFVWARANQLNSVLSGSFSHVLAIDFENLITRQQFTITRSTISNKPKRNKKLIKK